MSSPIIRATMAAVALAAIAAIPSHAARAPGANGWEIGPVIGSRNYSVGMPSRPTPTRRGLSFDFPYPSVRAGHVNALTFRHGPMTGKTKIVMRYRIDAAPGVRIVPRERPKLPATLTLFFQRRGDNWSARGEYETYRWYAPAHAMMELTPGEHEVTVRLDDKWKAVMATTAAKNPRAFRRAIDDTERVGFLLGSRGGRGHGVYATGPARFTIIDFRVI